MTRSEKVEMQVLVVIVGVLCLSLYFNNHTKPDLAPPASEAPRRGKPVVVQPVSQVDELPALLLLKRQAPLFSDSRRNVFEFSEGGEEQPAEEDPELAQDASPETQTETEPAPGSEIVFVGFYVEKDKPDSRLAAVSVNKNIMVVRKGDFLPGGYRIVKIEDDALTVSVIGEKKILRYPLGRSAPP